MIGNYGDFQKGHDHGDLCRASQPAHLPACTCNWEHRQASANEACVEFTNPLLLLPCPATPDTPPLRIYPSMVRGTGAGISAAFGKLGATVGSYCFSAPGPASLSGFGFEAAKDAPVCLARDMF